MANLNSSFLTPSILHKSTKTSFTVGSVGSENKDVGKTSNIEPSRLASKTATPKESKASKLSLQSSGKKTGTLSLSPSLLTSSLLQTKSLTSSSLLGKGDRKEGRKNEAENISNTKTTRVKVQGNVIGDKSFKPTTSLLKEPSYQLRCDVTSPSNLKLTSSSKFLTSSLLTKPSGESPVSSAYFSTTPSYISKSFLEMKLDIAKPTTPLISSSSGGGGFSSLLRQSSTASSGKVGLTKKDQINSQKNAIKKKKVQNAAPGLAEVETRPVHRKSDMKEPQYLLEKVHVEEKYQPTFLPPDMEAQLMKLQTPVHDVQTMKNCLINAVSASLIRAPDFKQEKDPVRVDLLQLVDKVSLYDGEFVLKLALYTRNELNIRTTGNFLLACASNLKDCRPFLRKYYKKCIRLPSDWIDVAEQYQAFHKHSSTNFGSLPAAMRRVMKLKFPDFDKYQLAKYNKENSIKKKRKKEKKKQEEGGGDGQRGRGRGGRGRGGRGRGRGRGAGTNLNTRDLPRDSSSGEDESDSDDDDRIKKELQRMVSQYSEQSETEEEIARLSFTLKQLIRKLHVTEPVEHVMCLIGKRYPSTSEDFYISRLPGTWEEERAGKRMKLPTPETWETQVSLKGNKAETWQDLLNNRKLPFMAMLRNLRNMIKAGISEKHHQSILKKLTDEGAVINSRQFPFRFFSAYEVLNQLDKDYEKNQQDIIEKAVENTSGAPTRGRGGRGGRGARGRGRGRGGRGGGSGGTSLPEEVKYDQVLLRRYRKALDQSVKIATLHNVKPIRGNTVIFVNQRFSMNRPCTSARGLGAPRTLQEVGVLLGLMCKYSCEESKMLVYGTLHSIEVELEKGTILNNMESVLQLQQSVNDLNLEDTESVTTIQMDLTELLRDRKQVDNMIILSDGMQKTSAEGIMVTDFLTKYRRTVNPNLLFVSVDLSGSSAKVDTQIQGGHSNDIYIAGFSDQILRYIAERGDGDQLIHVENIDTANNLKGFSMKGLEAPDKNQSLLERRLEKPLPLVSPAPKWRTARVFISSTFRDMHGERDLLTRFVFPELRARMERLYINVFEVDLRWGVTEEVSRSNKALEVCLSEVSKSQFFVGLLGERYGWVPDKYMVPDAPEFDWVRDYPSGASVTELEMYSAALSDPQRAQSKAFFYLRDQSFIKDVRKECVKDFEAEDNHAEERMSALKQRLCTSGLEVYKDYPCRWGGVLDNKPMVTGLEELGNRVLVNLMLAVESHYQAQDDFVDEWTLLTQQHEGFIECQKNAFVGRKHLLKQCQQSLKDMSSGGLLAVVGQPGCGKTALLANFITDYVSSRVNLGLMTLTHFIGSAVGSTNIVATLRRLNQELCSRFALDHVVAEEYKNLVSQFEELLQEVSKDVVGGANTSPLVILIDGLDLLEDVNQAQNLQWLPKNVPENVVLIVSAQEGQHCHRVLKQLKPRTITVGTLDILDKAQVIRATLDQHRKKLDESAFNNQMKLLTAKKDAANPFYLKLACEELRVYGLFEKIGTKLKSLPHTIPQLLQEILVRLEEDFGREDVSAALCFLACSRSGVHMADLYRLMRSPASEVNKTSEKKKPMPQALYAQLVRALQGFLRPLTGDQSEMLSLSHKEVISAVEKRYMTSVEVKKATHRQLARYYTLCANPPVGHHIHEPWAGKHELAFSELPYHLACAGCYSELKTLLCDLYFLRNKCRRGMARGLIEDFLAQGLKDKVSQSEHEKFQKLPEVQSFQKFITSNLHILLTHPALLWQQAVNEVEGSLVEVAVRRLMEEEASGCHNIMEVLNKPANTNPCVYTVSNMPTLVTCLAVSPDGNTLAAGSKDCMVHIYSLDTGKETLTLTGHSDQVTSVCFVGSGKLCSASGDTTLGLWDLSTGHRVSVLKGHSRLVGSCSANKKGDVIVSGGWDRQLKVWSVKSGKLDYDLKGDHGPVNCVAWHPDDALIAVGSWDSTIKIWDVYNKLRKAVLRGHMTSIRDVAYNPSGTHIASASLDGEVRLWASNNGSQVGTLAGHALPINRLTYSPRGHELITVSDDHKVKVWSGHLGQAINQMGQEEDGAVVSLSLHPDINVNTVAVGYHHGYIRVYDIPSGLLEYEVTHHTASVRAISYEKTGDYRLFTGSDDCTMKMLDSSTGAVLASFAGHTKPVLSVTVGLKYIVSTSEDVSACVFQLPYSFTSDTVLKPRHRLLGHTGSVTSSAFNGDETMLVTASRDMSLMFWKMDNLKKPFKVLPGAHMDWINGVSWSNSNDLLVTCSNDFCLKMWDTKSFTEKLKLTGHMSAVSSVAYSYGCIVSCGCDGEVKVWTHKGTEITSIREHTQRVNACDIFVQLKQRDIRPEIQTSTNWASMVEEDDWADKHDKVKLNKQVKVEEVVVASCSDDGTVRLWKPLQGNEVASLTGHSDRVVCVAATPNSKVCTAALDNTLKLWEPAPMPKGEGHKGEVSAIASDNGSFLITGSRDGTVKLWVERGPGQYTDRVYTWKAHSCAVSGLCFVCRGPGGMIASCSEDGSVKTWRIVSNMHGHVVKHVRTIKGKVTTASGDGCPLTGIHNVDFVKGHSMKVITTDWEENIKLWNLSTGKIEFQSNQARERNSKWILCSAVTSKNVLFYGSTDENNLPYSVELVPFIQDKKFRRSPLKAIDYSGNEDLSPNRRQANWLTAVSAHNQVICFGDVNGQITVQKENVSQRRTQKIHRDAITSIVLVSDYDKLIFTASKDGTIKVWTLELTQVGQYFAPSPVSRLEVLKQTPSQVTLACGDILGDIAFLVWNC